MERRELDRLEPKGPGGWPGLYRSRGDEVGGERPLFTGDVFRIGVEGQDDRLVQILQHPCALREDGVNLLKRLLVAEVTEDAGVEQFNWRGNFRLMPLPALTSSGDTPVHYVAQFASIDVVASATLKGAERVASLSQVGVNLLLQRWLHHNARVIVETFKLQDVTGGPFDEADLIEEWCEESDLDLDEAAAQALDWLREELADGSTRQQAIASPQNRSAIRLEMRKHLQSTG